MGRHAYLCVFSQGGNFAPQALNFSSLIVSLCRRGKVNAGYRHLGRDIDHRRDRDEFRA